MAYFTLSLVKKNIEILPSDTSLDATLNDYGAEADAHVDDLLGIATALATVPIIITHASSNYAAGRYLNRVKETARGTELINRAEGQIQDHIKAQRRFIVMG